MPQEDVSSYAPTATIDRQPLTNRYQITPESEEVRNHAQLMQADRFAEQDAHFERWERELKPNTEYDFILGQDEINPNSPVFETERPTQEHGHVTSVETDHTSEGTSQDEKMRAIIEQMSILEQTKMIISTGQYMVSIVRPQALEMSKIQR